MSCLLMKAPPLEGNWSASKPVPAFGIVNIRGCLIKSHLIGSINPAFTLTGCDCPRYQAEVFFITCYILNGDARSELGHVPCEVCTPPLRDSATTYDRREHSIICGGPAAKQKKILEHGSKDVTRNVKLYNSF